MTQLLDLLNGDSAHTLGLTLLHTLWQGALAAAALFIALKLIPTRKPNLRYAAAFGAMLTLVLAAFVTHAAVTLNGSGFAAGPPSPQWLSIYEPTPAPAPASSGTGILHVVAPTSQVSSTSTFTPAYPSIPWPALALVAWALARHPPPAQHVSLRHRHPPPHPRTRRRVRRTLGPGRPARPPTTPPHPPRRPPAHQRRRPHPLRTSALCFPVIVLPPALAANLTAEQLRVVLAHELAHIKRHDYLINLLQRLVEALLFFNPPVWWISRQLRLEREAACDAIAARALDDDRVHVARTLVDVLQQLTPAKAIPTAMALGQPQEDLPLATRIKRLLHPHLPDAVRLPWPTLLLALALTAATLYGVACGSESAAVAIAKLVTPDQYIAETRDIAAASPNFLPEARRDKKGRTVAKDRVHIAGVVVASDGAKLNPEQVRVGISWRRRGHGSGGPADSVTDPDDPTRLRFSRDIPPGEISLFVRAPGYAPISDGPYVMGPGTRKDDLVLTLQPGFDLPIQINDADGAPIPGVELEDFTIQRTKAGHSALETPGITTDAEGRAVLSHRGPQPLGLSLAVPGYQYTSAKITPKPGDVWTLTLQPAVPLTGTVLSDATGEPIVDAEVRIAWSSDNPRGWPDAPHRASFDAATNARGRFTLDTLIPDVNYTLYVSAPGHAPRFITGVIAPGAGSESMPHPFRLKPAFEVTLQVFGTPEQLAALPHNRRGKVRVTCKQSAYIETNYLTYNYEEVVLDTTTSPATAVFRSDLLDRPAIFILGSHETEIPDLRAAAESGPVRIDLARINVGPLPTRPVIVRLVPPAGWPAAQGTARVRYRSPRERPQHAH